MDMHQRGELDASVAMQLLGSGVGSVIPQSGDHKSGDHKSGVKRPHGDDGDAKKPDDPDESLDELLDQAKRAKMETLLYFLGFINPNVMICFYTVFHRFNIFYSYQSLSGSCVNV